MDLYKVWSDNGFISGPKLWAVVKAMDPSLKRKDVLEFVAKQKTAQIHKPVTQKKGYYMPIVSQDRYKDFQMDLLDFQKFSAKNNGYSWLLVLIDIFSRKAFVYPLKNKTAGVVAESLAEFFKHIKPERISSDDGPEFKGAVSALLKSQKIEHRTTAVGDHRVLGVIDRMSKTIKNMVYRHFTEMNTTEWTKVINTFIHSYNKRPHEGVCGMSPDEAEKYNMTTRECHLEKVRDSKQYEFAIGERVRFKLAKQTFGRGFDAQYSKAIYEVKEVQGNAFVLSNGKSYRGADLQRVKGLTEAKEQEEAVDNLQEAKKDAKKRRLAFKEVAVGHEAERITPDGKIELKGRLKPANEKRVIRKPRKYQD